MKNRGVGRILAGTLKFDASDEENGLVCERIKIFLLRYYNKHDIPKLINFDIFENRYKFNGKEYKLNNDNQKLKIKLDYYGHAIVIDSARWYLDFEMHVRPSMSMFDIFKTIVDLYQPMYDLETRITTIGEVNDFYPGGTFKSAMYISRSKCSSIENITFYKYIENDESEKYRLEITHSTDGMFVLTPESFPDLVLTNNLITIFDHSNGNRKLKIYNDTPKGGF